MIVFRPEGRRSTKFFRYLGVPEEDRVIPEANLVALAACIATRIQGPPVDWPLRSA